MTPLESEMYLNLFMERFNYFPQLIDNDLFGRD